MFFIVFGVLPIRAIRQHIRAIPIQLGKAAMKALYGVNASLDVILIK